MPTVPSCRPGLVVAGGSGSLLHPAAASDLDMLDGNANLTTIIGQSPSPADQSSPTNTLHRPPANSSSSSSSTPCNPDKSDQDAKNFRNKSNPKGKVLTRSLAMRESTSPPTSPHNGPTSPHSPQSMDSEKFVNVLSPSSTVSNAKLNNNEAIFNSNLCPVQSPKQMRNSATSPTCRTPSRNGQSSPCQVHSPKSAASPTNGNNKAEHRTKVVGTNVVQKCNNCVKNNQTERPGLLQTPASPTKPGQPLQHSPKSTNLGPATNNQQKSEQRRQNTLNACNNQCSAQCGNTLSVSRPGSRHKLRHQNSSQGSFDNASPCLSRDSSTELYTDSTGIDLEQFIAETINRNQKDRTVLLKIEKDLIEFVKDRQKVCHKFPTMSSYNRMLVHRVAAYFGMEHNVDQSGQSVIVTRTKNMRIPDTRFKEHIRDDLILPEEPRRSILKSAGNISRHFILKRDSSSFEDNFNCKSPDRMSGDYNRRSKSFEEREEEYERARRRIFKDSSCESGEVTSWPWSSSESSDNSARYRLLHPSSHTMRQARLLKNDSLEERELVRGGVLRPSVSKSFSFGGYTRSMLAREDSVTSTHSAGARLTKQDSGASMCSRLSPSSSGYKSQSQRSDVTISPSLSPSPVPAMTCSHTQVSGQDLGSPDSNGQTVIWAVSSISSVPAGSIIINPQTNQPYTNADGSIYRFDPENPPKCFGMDTESSNKHSDSVESPRNSSNNLKPEKKRSQTKFCTGSTTTTASVTNSATSPSLPFTPPPSQQAVQPQQQQTQQQPQQQQNLVKTPSTVAACPYNQSQSYTTYVATSENFTQAVYPPSVTQPTVIMPSHQAQHQPAAPQNNSHPPELVFNQNPTYNYTVPAQQTPVQQTNDGSDLSGYFMGMNIYDQRAAGDSHSTPPQTYPQPTQTTTQAIQNVQANVMQPNYWQPPPNQMPLQQTMYFVPPPATAISMSQNPGDRQQIHQQQRFATNYSFSGQSMTPPSQSNSNYVGSYPVPYNSMAAMTPNPTDYTYQPPVHMVPTYYPPGQPTMQPPPVMYRVPTPPNTPTSTQMPGMPLMYVNSGNYAPPTMVTAGTLGHQVGPNGTSPAPPGTYMTPALVPNLVFRQNVPVVANMRASTPGSSQRTSRSPTPAHELFGGGSGDRNAQSQTRYPLPMYQGVHIVQGDMRLVHPGVPANPRLQYASASSPPVVQGCPRPYRPSSYSSNASGAGTPTSFDGRNQKMRKQRSKVGSLPPAGARPALYQTPSMPALSSTPKDIREAKPVEDNMI
ncbi:R3H domain-containing protein 1 isoform X2 [Prorops nasuta]|uniref:R3H domain-containing protein 1 isoform X2 n=1 Tax=Prorops nasuta TaxID=863751 RepID=UPI0034CEDAA4